MKNWLTQAVAAFFIVATLASCEKDDDKATLAPSSPIAFSASTNNVVLTQAARAQTAVTFTWAPATLAWSGTDSKTVPAISGYQLQFSTRENNFAGPITIPAPTSPTTAVTVAALNTALVQAGLKPNESGTILVRLAAIVGADTKGIHSEPLTITATPYPICVAPNSDRWSIIGTAGVDWNTDVPLVYECDSRTYQVTRTFNAGEFKFRKNSDWAVNYGSNAARDANGSAALALGGNNITITTPGTYTLILNISTQTYTLR